MESFINNLKDLIIESNLSLRQLASKSGVTCTQYSRYLNGKIPTIAITVKIAKYFNCSLDYLFNLTEVRNSKAKTHNYDLSKFLERYQKLLIENHTTHYKLMKESQFDESILRHWKKGSTPRLDVLYFIAKSLNGSIDYLIGMS